MTAFLTLEDINTAIYNQGTKNMFHVIDTALISDNREFTNVKYDFVKVSRSTNMGEVTYTFEIINENWTGGYCFFYSNGNWVLDSNETITVQDNVIQITTSQTSIQLMLHCYNWRKDSEYSFQEGYIRFMPLEEYNNGVSRDLEHVGVQETLRGQDMKLDTEVTDSTQTFNQGLVTYHTLHVGSNEGYNYYVYVSLLKTDLEFTCNQVLDSGMLNTVKLGVDSKYKPGGSLIGNNPLDINVIYQGKTLPATWNNALNDYTFQLDLSDKRDTGKILIKVIVEKNKVINHTETNVVLSYDYLTVNTFNELKTACETTKPNVLKFGADITVTGNDNLVLDHNILIYGENHKLTLSDKSIIINPNRAVVFEDLEIKNGDPAIIQKNNSDLLINNCLFNDNTSTDYGNLGASIHCDVDFENLSITDDFKTTITDTQFISSKKGNEILHSGELIINNCKFHKNNINPSVVSFLYQLDGEASIRNSIFDIDSRDTIHGVDGGLDYNCSNEINAGYGQALIMCGETAIINGATHEELQNDNTLPFLEPPYNNLAHVFLKYYYPQISECVYSSPIIGKEDKSCCHAVSGKDWAFKNNVQITRASWGTENENRKITWE